MADNNALYAIRFPDGSVSLACPPQLEARAYDQYLQRGFEQLGRIGAPVLVGFGSFLGLNWETARAKVDDANRVLGALSVIVTVAIGVWLWRRRQKN